MLSVVCQVSNVLLIGDYGTEDRTCTCTSYRYQKLEMYDLSLTPLLEQTLPSSYTVKQVKSLKYLNIPPYWMFRESGLLVQISWDDFPPTTFISKEFIKSPIGLLSSVKCFSTCFLHSLIYVCIDSNPTFSINSTQLYLGKSTPYTPYEYRYPVPRVLSG